MSIARANTGPLRPNADRFVDVVAVAVLAACGLVGFRPVFGGTDWLVVGGSGIAAGIAIAWVGLARRLGSLAVAGLAVAAYLALSGLSAPNDGYSAEAPM